MGLHKTVSCELCRFFFCGDVRQLRGAFLQGIQGLSIIRILLFGVCMRPLLRKSPEH